MKYSFEATSFEEPGWVFLLHWRRLRVYCGRRVIVWVTWRVFWLTWKVFWATWICHWGSQRCNWDRTTIVWLTLTMPCKTKNISYTTESIHYERTTIEWLTKRFHWNDWEWNCKREKGLKIRISNCWCGWWKKNTNQGVLFFWNTCQGGNGFMWLVKNLSDALRNIFVSQHYHIA